MRPPASQTGQSTLEYAGVVLLTCALLAGLALVPFDGRPIAGAVTHQLAYALCVVSRGDCDQDRQPCATASEGRGFEWSMHVLFAKAGKHHLLVREDRSDGTAALSLVRRFAAGASASTGLKATLSLGRRSFALGGEVSAELLAETGDGSTWVLPKARADELQGRLLAHFAASPASDVLPGALVDRLLPGLPRPSQTFGEAGVSGSIEGSLAGRLSIGARLGGEGVLGRRIDSGTGRRTSYLRIAGELSGALQVARLGDAAGDGSGEVSVAITSDRQGLPIDLAVVQTGSLAGTATLDPLRRPASGAASAREPKLATGGERRWVRESHLDLTDAGNRAAAARFVGQALTPVRLASAIAAARGLAAALRERAVINLRTYAVERSAKGFSLDGSLAGVGAGGSVEYSREASHLVSADTRGLDGVWRSREDCLIAARSGRAQAPAI